MNYLYIFIYFAQKRNKNMPSLKLYCIKCKTGVVSCWIEELCDVCKNNYKKKIMYPESCKLVFVSGKYVWKQYGVGSCSGKPILKSL